MPTSPQRPLAGSTSTDACVVAPIGASQQGGTHHLIRAYWLVAITNKDGSTRSFRWPTRAKARTCARDFPHGKPVIEEVLGYTTGFSGFVRVR